MAVSGAAAIGPDVSAQARVESASRSLTAAERHAITVASLSAVADPTLGIVVGATFEGDVEHFLGQGNLRGAQLALASGGGTLASAPVGLVDAGGGFTVARFPVLARSRGKLVLTHETIRLFSSEHVRSIGTGLHALALRVGNQVIFDLTGLSPSETTAARVQVFAGAAGSAGGARPTSVASVGLGSSRVTVEQLHTLQQTLAGALHGGLVPELRQELHARAQLDGAIRDGRTLARLVNINRASLLQVYRRSGAGLVSLRTKIAMLERLIARVTVLLTASLHPSVTAVQTDPALSQEMASEPPLPLSPLVPSGVPVISVDASQRYQQFQGIGGTLTDSSAWLIERELPPAAGVALIQALFGEAGSQNALGAPALHLAFLRLALGASGAMTVGGPYSYDDLAPGQSDPSLTSFSIAHDSAYIIPAVKQALATDPQLEILANPWSPPAWMKTNDSLDNDGGVGSLLPSAFAPFADYLVKSIQAYADSGIPIAAITPQNEPSSGQLGTAYPGLTLPEPDEAHLINDDLAPALHAAGLTTRIYGGDLSWDSLPYADGLTTGDVSGIAWHCYYGSPTVMSQLHAQAPNLDQIVDECSPEVRPVGTPEFLISSLRNWASEVAVWALALDPAGGPIQPGNDCVGCTGPVTINEQTQSVALRPEYYQLGQVSAFVQPGAVRIGSQSQVRYGVDTLGYETATPGLDDVAFRNPDGSLVLIADDNSQSPITFGVDCGGRLFTATLPPRAMTTFVWR